MFNIILKHSLKEFKALFFSGIGLSIFSFLLGYVLEISTNQNSKALGIVLLIIIAAAILYMIVFLFIIGINSYMKAFIGEGKYQNRSLPISLSKIFNIKILSLIIAVLYLSACLFVPLRLATLISCILNNKSYTSFFIFLFNQDNLVSTVNIIFIYIWFFFHLINIILCINLSKLHIFKKISVITLTFTLGISITIYQLILYVFQLSLINPIINYLISSIFTLSFIGIEIFLISKTINKIDIN